MSTSMSTTPLIAAAPDLLAALKGVLAGFEAGAFSRNTENDGDPGWAIKFLPHVKALADAAVAVSKAEAKPRHEHDTLDAEIRG